MTLRIARSLLDDVIDHARAEAPNECCGVIAGRDGRALVVHRARNRAASPLKYDLHPQDQLAIQTAVDDAGQEFVAIYHSHTRTAPVPSQTDINLARMADGAPRFPGTLYVIVGLDGGAEPDVRVWDLAGDDVAETELVLEDG